MPSQLQLSLLNVPPAMDSIAMLPRPQHVILNHMCVGWGGVGWGGVAWRGVGWGGVGALAGADG
jgi:hypothetical protein